MSATQGLIHLYVGDGKGKTTAAAGLCMRALGQGKRVLFSQFLKGRPTGEIDPLQRLGAKVERAKTSDKFTFQMDEDELAETRRTHRSLLTEVSAVAAAGDADLIIMDEVVDAVNTQVISLDDLLSLIDGRAPSVELVLTGRNPPDALCERCDYHTEFRCVKHPYQRGVAARQGIEY